VLTVTVPQPVASPRMATAAAAHRADIVLTAFRQPRLRTGC